MCSLNNSYSVSHLKGYDLDAKKGERRKHFYFDFPGQLSFLLHMLMPRSSNYSAEFIVQNEIHAI